MTVNVVVVGGGDFIGRRVALALAEKSGFQVRLVDVSACLLNNIAVDFVRCDLRNPATLFPLLSGANLIVNCVAGSGEFIRRSGQSLYAAASRAGKVAVLQLSTYAAYGSLEGHVTEGSTLLGDIDDYARARAEVDRLGQAYGALCLRPGIVYGPGSVRWSGQIASLLCARRLGDIGAFGDGWCNLVYIDDLVAIIATIVGMQELPAGGLNLCSSERLTWNDYFQLYAKALGAVPLQRIGASRLSIETKLYAPLLKVGTKVIGRQMGANVPPMITPSMLRVFGQLLKLDSSRAQHWLSLTWTPASTGVVHAANWYTTEYHTIVRT